MIGVFNLQTNSCLILLQASTCLLPPPTSLHPFNSLYTTFWWTVALAWIDQHTCTINNDAAVLRLIPLLGLFNCSFCVAGEMEACRHVSEVIRSLSLYIILTIGLPLQWLQTHLCIYMEMGTQPIPSSSYYLHSHHSSLFLPIYARLVLLTILAINCRNGMLWSCLPPN